MPYYKFKENDLFYNRIKAFPECQFWIYRGKTYYNNIKLLPGSLNGTTPVTHVPTGSISLYELNVDRPSDSLIYPFITKDGGMGAFKTVSLSSFNTGFNYGDIITGEYPLSATISKERWAEGAAALLDYSHIEALQNTLDFYKPLSNHYAFDSSLGDKFDQALGLVSVPSIFYGSSIKKGSVYLRFYVSGTLAAELHDRDRNGELIEVSSSDYPANTGKVAGVVLYNEGCVVLTGSWDISSHTENYLGAGAINPDWTIFGQSLVASANETVSSSYYMTFKGTNYIPTITMMAHADRGKINHSNNPTYLKKSTYITPETGSVIYKEYDKLEIQNVVSGAYCNQAASFEKQTYISKVGIYDEDKNLIAVAKFANPVRKKQTDDYTFKLKLDF